jgi:hypothetical protein
VLVPCWNAATTIADALASVLEVDDVALQCIVVDDGSTDRTAAVVAELAAHDPRIELVSLTMNGGVSAARNAGLERVRGTWLTLLDADDRFLPGGLATLVHAAIATDARAVVGQQLVTDGRRRWLPALYDVPDLRTGGRRSLVGSPGLLNSVSPHAKLFHRSAFEGLRFSGRVLGDQPWIICALIRAGDAIEVVDSTVYLWHRPPSGEATGSITSTTRASASRSVVAIDVARTAVEVVASEAAVLGPTSRDTIVRAYVDRLFRADLGPMLGLAIDRRDQHTADVIDALRAFMEGVPPDHLTGAALARELLERPLRRWSWLDEGARAAFGRLAAAALAADPGCVRRRPLLARIGLAAGLASRGRTRHAVAAAAIVGQRALDRASRAVHRRFVRTG